MDTHQQPSSKEEIAGKISERYLEMLVTKKTKGPVTHHWVEAAVLEALTSHSEAIRERVDSKRKDLVTRQVHWLQTINKTNRRRARWEAIAYNAALDDILALLNDSDV